MPPRLHLLQSLLLSQLECMVYHHRELFLLVLFQEHNRLLQPRNQVYHILLVVVDMLVYIGYFQQCNQVHHTLLVGLLGLYIQDHLGQCHNLLVFVDNMLPLGYSHNNQCMLDYPYFHSILDSQSMHYILLRLRILHNHQRIPPLLHRNVLS
jgi:hypothetical protein